MPTRPYALMSLMFKWYVFISTTVHKGLKICSYLYTEACDIELYKFSSLVNVFYPLHLFPRIRTKIIFNILVYCLLNEMGLCLIVYYVL